MNAVTGNDMTYFERLKTQLVLLEHWKPQIETAMRHGRRTHTFDDVVQMIMAERLHFFSYPEAFIIIELVQYPQFKTFHCFAAGGKMSALLAAIDEMKVLAKALDCRHLSITGRKGWERVLGRHGWGHLCSTMFLPIEEQQNV